MDSVLLLTEPVPKRRGEVSPRPLGVVGAGGWYLMAVKTISLPSREVSQT